MDITNEIVCDDNGRPLKVISTQHAKKGDVVTEYHCVSQRKIDTLGKDYIDYCKTEKSVEASVYLLALERIGISLFGELPEAPVQEHDFTPRKKMIINGLEYFEDEVLERLGQLHPVKSIWRK